MGYGLWVINRKPETENLKPVTNSLTPQIVTYSLITLSQ